MRIILASASPRRRELMKYITTNFEAVSLDCDETLPDSVLPEQASQYLAELKASEAAKKYPDAVIIGCDTTVICNGDVLGKPEDHEQCTAYMKMLSGRVHQVVTGCSLMYRSAKKSFSVVTDVRFRELSDSEIKIYASSDEPYDKAGGYGIQGKGALLVEKIDGDFYNVVGLPVSRLNIELKNFINTIKGESLI